MLPLKRRLKKELIKKILKYGKNVFISGISLKFLAISGLGSAFTFVVPAKIAKKATQRNLLKRRGGAVVFNLISEIKEGYLVVIFFGKESVNMKFPELASAIKHLFKKAGFLNQSN